MSGYIYCLYDLENKVCRIGKTKSENMTRQNMQIGYASTPIINYLTVKVDDYSKAESILHNYFKADKKRADWYKIKPVDFLNAVMEKIQGDKVFSFENPNTVVRQLLK